MEAQEHRLTVPAILEHIEEACEFVSGIARTIGMSDDAVYHCYLSVEEICTNIIEHGYKYQGQDEVIEVVCLVESHLLTIVILDDAHPFNPLKLGDPDPKAPLMERRGGGWGVFFVKKYMDSVTYHYDGSRNQLVLQKQF
ncbi:MAG: ATP-binding protein [Anaerolineae bacterium]